MIFLVLYHQKMYILYNMQVHKHILHIYFYMYIFDAVHTSFIRLYMCIYVFLCEEFTGRDRPRQLALNGSTTEYVLKNLVHDTEYVLSLYVLFGSVVGPGITATFRTCEWPETFSCFLDKDILTVSSDFSCLLVESYVMRSSPQHPSDTCQILK